jgi:hypothetical protein
VPVRVRGDQAVTIQNDPLIRVPGAIFPDPVHFTLPIARRYRRRDSPRVTRTGSINTLQSVGKAQDLLLLRWWQAAHLIRNCFFEAHA